MLKRYVCFILAIALVCAFAPGAVAFAEEQPPASASGQPSPSAPGPLPGPSELQEFSTGPDPAGPPQAPESPASLQGGSSGPLSMTPNEDEAALLKAFLNAGSAEPGKTNGALLNEQYDENSPESWAGVTWDENGRVTRIDWENGDPQSGGLAGALDLTDFTELAALNVAGNRLTALTLTGDAKLATLHCGGNLLTTLDAGASGAMADLECAGNQLTYVRVFIGAHEVIAESDDGDMGYVELLYNPTDYTVSAAPRGTALFETWQDGDTPVSSEREMPLYAGTPYHLTAVFGPNPDDASPADGYIDADFNAMRAFLEQLSADGETKNGFVLSAEYNSDDPLTWRNVEWFLGRIHAVHWNNMEGDLGGSLAGSLDLSPCTGLYTLECPGNSISAIDVSGCVNLQNLHCGFNWLQTLDVSANTALTDFDCTVNPLTYIHATIGGNDVQVRSDSTGYGCVFMHYEENGAYRVNTGPFGSALFKNWTNKANGVTTVFSTAVEPDLDTGKAYNLTANYTANAADRDGDGFVDNDYNKLLSFLKLTSAEAGKTNGQVLNPDFDQTEPKTWAGLAEWKGGYITSIHWEGADENGGGLAGRLDLSGCVRLNTLNVPKNSLTSIILTGDAALTSLSCRYNSLTALDVSSCKALEYLDVGFNSLSALNISALTKLISLDALANNIPSISLTNNKLLENLEIGANKLTAINVTANTKLWRLGVNGNNLQGTLDLTKNTSLTNVLCEGNQTTAIRANIKFEGGVKSVNLQAGGGFVSLCRTTGDNPEDNRYYAAADPKPTVHFKNWTGSPLEAPAEDSRIDLIAGTAYNLSANFVVYAYFNPQGGSDVDAAEVPYNTAFAAPAAPAKDFNTFKGWYKEAECKNAWSFTTKATGDVWLYAKWETNKYAVNFYNGTTKLYSQTVAHGSKAAIPAACPTRTGQGFKGWYTAPECEDSQFYDFFAPVTQGLNLYAGWEPGAYTVFVVSDGKIYDVIRPVALSALIARPGEPDNPGGMTFGGWYKDAAYRTAWNFAADKVTKSVNLYARWQYQVELRDSVGGNVLATLLADPNKAMLKPVYTKPGHTLAGSRWYGDQECTKVWNFTTDTVKNNISLYGNFTPNTYTVTFGSNGGSSVAAKKTAFDAPFAEPVPPVKAGFTFAGWYRDNGAFQNRWDFSQSMKTAGAAPVNLTLYAKWVDDRLPTMPAGGFTPKGTVTGLTAQMKATGIADPSGVEYVRFIVYNKDAGPASYAMYSAIGAGTAWTAAFDAARHNYQSGEYVVNVWAKDRSPASNYGLIGTFAFTVNLPDDDSAPTLTGVTPAANANVSSSVFTLAANGVADPSGVRYVYFYIEGTGDNYFSNTVYAVRTGSTWKAAINMSRARMQPGRYDVYVYGVDGRGNYGLMRSYSLNLQADVIEPACDGFTPADGSGPVTSAQVALTAHVTDPSGVAAVKFEIWFNGDFHIAEGENTGGDIWKAEIDAALWENGDYTVYVWAQDRKGNSGWVSGYGFTLSLPPDGDAPACTGIDLYFNDTAYMFTAAAQNVTDPSGVADVYFKVYKESQGPGGALYYYVEPETGSWSVTVNLENFGNESGNYVVEAYGIDKRGNVSAAPMASVTRFLGIPE